MEVNGVLQLFGYRHYSEYLFFCVCVQHEKEIHTGLEQLEGEEMMTILLF